MKLFLSFLFFLSGCLIVVADSHKTKSDNYVKEEKYPEAIKELEKHIDERLKAKRPEWENPYTYYLDIGDIYLKQDQIDKALEYYNLALKSDVKKEYVADRMRTVAIYYEDKNEVKLAIEHLKKFRDLDPDFTDMMMDRLARKFVKSR